MRCQSNLCKINGCMFPQACPNDAPITASPLREERLAELQKALDEIIPRNFSLLLDTFDDDDWTDAHAALLALFDRQREEMARREVEVADSLAAAGRAVEGLSSQLERLSEWKSSVLSSLESKPDFVAGKWAGDKQGWGYVFEYINWIHRELERLKAERISREELAFLVGVGEPKDYCFAWGCFCVRCKDMKAKLHRRLSQSPQPE